MKSILHMPKPMVVLTLTTFLTWCADCSYYLNISMFIVEGVIGARVGGDIQLYEFGLRVASSALGVKAFSAMMLQPVLRKLIIRVGKYI